MFLNKKGFVVDAAFSIVMLFAIALSIVVLYVLFSSINSAIQDNSQIDSASKALMSDSRDRFTSVWDYGFLTLFIGVAIALMITSYVLQTNTGLFFLVLVIVAILGGVAGYLANAFTDVINDGGVLQNSAANFPITSYLMNHYMLGVIVIVFLMLIVFFGKPSGGAA